MTVVPPSPRRWRTDSVRHRLESAGTAAIASRPGWERRRSPAGSPHQAQAEAVEPGGDLIGVAVEDAGHGPRVVTPDRQHAPVVVTPLDLDHAQVAGEHLALLAAELLGCAQVDGDGAIVTAGGGGGRGGDPPPRLPRW